MAKGPEAFRTISEAADELHVPQHVLRFWETKFAFIRPMKRAGGRRFYRPSDIAVLRGVRRLLHDEGYTIKGVQRLHREEGLGRLVGETS
ncbi:MAG TPA: MerR family transcriptional regulator, partial [Phenylobacterium sp.]|nr:MerR family transcriptional regulator [Phenylobacterium sp.]